MRVRMCAEPFVLHLFFSPFFCSSFVLFWSFLSLLVCFMFAFHAMTIKHSTLYSIGERTMESNPKMLELSTILNAPFEFGMRSFGWFGSCVIYWLLMRAFWDDDAQPKIESTKFLIFEEWCLRRHHYRSLLGSHYACMHDVILLWLIRTSTYCIRKPLYLLLFVLLHVRTMYNVHKLYSLFKWVFISFFIRELNALLWKGHENRPTKNY